MLVYFVPKYITVKLKGIMLSLFAYASYGLTISQCIQCGVSGVVISLLPDAPNFYYNTFFIASITEARNQMLSYNNSYVPHF